ncbi:MAG: hypothetical protein GXP29_03910, partial [Planctomycetes bacterium]|nr:hypothetical protein [Planctomycetota bacterium]
MKTIGANKIKEAWMLTFLLAVWLTGCGISELQSQPSAADVHADADTGVASSTTPQPESQVFRAVDQVIYVQTDTPRNIALTYLDGDASKTAFEIIAKPKNGTLSGDAPRMTYTPKKDFIGEDRLTFRVRQGERSVEGSIKFVTSKWTPPIGIPAPPFGIVETVERQYGTANFQTHYIDNTHARATDSSNPTGSPERPRQSIPTELPAGSVVALAGGPYSYRIGGTIPIHSLGTADAPVFIRSVDPKKPVRFTESVTMTGQYLIVENVVFDGGNPLLVKKGPHHMALRHSEVTRCGGPAVQLSSWDGEPIHNIVIYDCEIHDNGNIHADFDEDYHGIGVGGGVSSLWVVDNRMYRNSGDGIQINAGNSAGQASTHHIYVGRNVAYENKQTGMWCKQATDVIFSQNTA